MAVYGQPGIKIVQNNNPYTVSSYATTGTTTVTSTAYANWRS